MGSNTNCTVSGIKFVRKFRGKSQAALIEANDNQQYVVKWMSEHGSTASPHKEAFRNSLYQVLGLPVSSWTPIEIQDQLIDSFPEMRIDSAAGPIRPAAGIYFGSRNVSHPLGRSYEVLPANWYPRVVNREDFWRAFVFDIWTERLDRRQAIFTSFGDKSDLMAVFIDHGDPSTPLKSEPGLFPCLYPDMRVYLEFQKIEIIRDSVAQILRHGRDAVAIAHETLPSEWKSSSLDSDMKRFISRIYELPKAHFWGEFKRDPHQEIALCNFVRSA